MLQSPDCEVSAEMDHYETIKNCLRSLECAHGVQIVIKDYVGFVNIDKQLDASLLPYLGHNNAYCMFVKQTLGHNRCLAMMRPLYNKCGRCLNGFSGMCYAGMSERVVPIHLSGEVLGSINVGYMDGDAAFSLRALRRAFSRVDEPTRLQAEALLQKNVKPLSVTSQALEPTLLLLADCLAQNYKQFQSSHVFHMMPDAPRYSTNTAMILRLAMEHIRINYVRRLTVGDIARVCCCSESYINHMFKKTIGVNVNTYVNKVRIEHAKNALLMNSDKISTIALDVGFNDSNYFSKVFADLTGISPSEFRRRYTP